jgi:hypothetical protein
LPENHGPYTTCCRFVRWRRAGVRKRIVNGYRSLTSRRCHGSAPTAKDSRGSDSGPCACLDDAEVIPDSSNVRKEKMLHAQFPGRRRASPSNRDKNQLEPLSIPAEIGGVSVGIQVRTNLNLTIPPFLVLLRNDLYRQTDASIADEPARSCHGLAPQRGKDSRRRRQWSTRMSG